MKRRMGLSARDSRDLLLACLKGVGCGVLGIALAGLIWHLAGFGTLPAAGLLLVMSVLIGAGAGLLLFLQSRLWEPLDQLIRALPRRATEKMTLVVDRGIAPLRLLSHRINGLINQLQGIVAENQQEFTVLAHDLRGPLTRLLLRMQALRQHQQPDAELMAGLEADVKALVAFDQELAELAQPSGRSLALERLVLEPFCREIAANYAPHLVELHVAAELSVLVDRRMLQRTLNNLIDNALDYGAPPVLISARSTAALVVISVDDAGADASGGEGHPKGPPHGPLLPPAHQGLGLAIARGFCQRHGGSLELGRSARGGWQVRLSLRASPALEQLR